MLCMYITFARPEQTLKHNLLWVKKPQNNNEYEYFILFMTHLILNFNATED